MRKKIETAGAVCYSIKRGEIVLKWDMMPGEGITHFNMFQPHIHNDNNTEYEKPRTGHLKIYGLI